MKTPITTLLGIVLAACSSPSTDANPSGDAADAWRRHDAGGTGDAGSSASSDAGGTGDAASTGDSGSDSGTTADAGSSMSGPVTTLDAASCSQADVQAAVASASSASGNVVVQLPACTQTWASPVAIDTRVGFASVSSMTIRGYGNESGRGSTGATAISGSGILVTSSPNKPIRVSNLKMQGQISIGGTGRPGNGGGWRIDHITFENATDRVVWVGGYTYGVIDSSVLDTSSAVIVGIRESGVVQGVDADGGNASWSRAPSFGTAEAVYIEDNSMTYTGNTVHMCVDSDGGGRFVFRYNTTTNCYAGTHDASSVGDTRSAYSWEIYNNKMTTTMNYGPGLAGLRGGTGYYFNNDLMATDPYPFYGDAIHLTNYRSFDYASASPWTTSCADGTSLRICTNAPESAHSCSTDQDCSGVPGSCQAADDPSGDGTGYPCRDQIGRSTGMSLFPALFWNNRLQIAGGAFQNQYPGVDGSGRVPQHIVLDRDYCQAQTSMPTTCNGVTTAYAPYTYPHPLRGSL